MMWLAWHARDERTRDVARRWRALGRTERNCTDIEALCDEAGLHEGEFLGAVVATAFELGINVAPVIGGITAMPQRLTGIFGMSAYSEAGREQAVLAMEFFARRFSVDRRR
jgi:hypothetical protein